MKRSSGRRCTFGALSTFVALFVPGAGPAAKVVREDPESFDIVETLTQGAVSVNTHARL